MAYEDQGRALEWDDYIEHDGLEFILLPAGDYDFEVTGIERSRHNGTEKIPPCNKVVASLQIVTPNGQTTIKHNLFLHTNVEGLLCAFFNSIGQRQKGDKFKMNWNKVVGSKGRAKITIRKFMNNNNEETERNQVSQFYEAPEKNFKAGVF
jgi:hypothetical protein